MLFGFSWYVSWVTCLEFEGLFYKTVMFIVPVIVTAL